MQGWRLEPNSAALMPSSTAYTTCSCACCGTLLRALRWYSICDCTHTPNQVARRAAYAGAAMSGLPDTICCHCRTRQRGRLGRQDSPTTSTVEGCSRTVGESRSALTMLEANQTSVRRKRENLVWFTRMGCRVKLRPGRCLSANGQGAARSYMGMHVAVCSCVSKGCLTQQ